MLRFDRIEALMKLNNLTQTELLARAGQSVNNFSRWIRKIKSVLVIDHINC